MDFLQDVGKDSISNVCQLIALLLCFPVFKISNFLFKLSYRFNQRRAFLLAAKTRCWAPMMAF